MPHTDAQLPSLRTQTAQPKPLLPLQAAQTMGGPHLGIFHVLHVLCVLLALLGSGPQNTRASATMGCAGWCPPSSICVNATACRCAQGFISSSGEIITNPSESCDDINECGPPLSVTCGKLADCQNTEGSYYCMCNPGYRLASGATRFSNASQNTCQDMDGCQLNPGPCKSHHICVSIQDSYTCKSTLGLEIEPKDLKLCKDVNECTSGQNPCHKSIHCINTVGSYRCRCRRGWKPVPGSPNGPDNTVCEDVDECTSGQNPCHKSARCVNTMGSYRCRCFGGWKPVPGSPNGPNNTVCEDVDECHTGKQQCDNSTTCVNTQGLYTCHCHRGWVPKPGFLDKQNTTQCEEVPFPTWTPPPGIKSQSLSRFFEKVQGLGRDPKPTSPQDTIQIFIKLVDELLEDPGDLEALTLTDQHRLATHLLSYLEEVLRTLAKIIPENFIYHSPSKSELSLVIQEQGNGTVIMGQSHARMRLNWAEAVEIGEYGPTIAGMFSSQNMQRLLANAPLDLDLDPEKKTQLTIFSAVNTVFLSNRNTEKLNSSVDFAFSHLQKTPDPKLGSRHELICAFWKGSDGGGYWATTGCQKLGSGNNSTTCRCSHLSSFAILMAHYDVEDPKLTLITKVGLSLSLVCLLLCILTFLLVRPIQGSRTTVHLHLSICLFLGSAIFLAGIENEGEGGQVSLRCRLVTGLLHYCFLASFCWMSLEGLELYFLVVHVFRREGLSKRWLYLIGYGIPGLIVAISVAVSSGYYHERTRFCWLTTSNGFLWSFNGPVTFIILCNAIIFVITIWKLTLKFSEINPDMKKLKKARVLTITAMAQLVVLGGTWVSGPFLFERNNYVLAYLFTILSCLQGFFIFLLHCLLNKKVREEYRKWAYMVTGNKYSDFTTSTSNSSNNQTKVLRPSESGM